MQQVKGNILKSRLAFVEQQAGEEGKQRVLEELPPGDREALRTLLTVKWYPFELGKRLDDAIVRVLGDGDPAYFERLGEASAEQNLRTLHKAFLAPGKPHVFLGKAQAIYGLYYEQGRREYTQTGASEGVLTTYGAETFSRPDCLTVMGWYRRALELCGASGVRVVEEECRASGGEVCRYRMSWE
ncbi:MAG TPA: hypothetical protein VFX98_16115 [Longimicrobiaceae bacterium]|nr:hypothetical protein [Longimicrobiaceae bacterium]